MARKLLGPEKIVGATAKTVEAAKKAWEEGADYLGVGAIYPTNDKGDHDSHKAGDIESNL